MLLAAVVCTSCTGKTGDASSSSRTEIISYKGASKGEGIPGWVMDAMDGNMNAVKKVFGLEEKRFWVLQRVSNGFSIADEVIPTSGNIIGISSQLSETMQLTFSDARGQICSGNGYGCLHTAEQI